MSLNSLAREAVEKEIAAKKDVAAEDVAAEDVASPQPPSRDDSLAALTKYLPTESITLYIATVSASGALIKVAPRLTPDVIYRSFIALTPVLLLLLFLRRLAVDEQDWKVHPSKWPWWRMFASTIAFSVWALAVSANPVIKADNDTAGVLAGLAALFVSTFLSLLEPFFEKKQP